MSARTVTAPDTAGELLGELRQLVARYDGAATVDELQALLDDLGRAAGRARRRLTRLRRDATSPVDEPPPPAAPTPAPAPAPPVGSQRPPMGAPDPTPAAGACPSAVPYAPPTSPGRPVPAAAEAAVAPPAPADAALRVASRRRRVWWWVLAALLVLLVVGAIAGGAALTVGALADAATAPGISDIAGKAFTGDVTNPAPDRS